MEKIRIFYETEGVQENLYDVNEIYEFSEKILNC